MTITPSTLRTYSLLERWADAALHGIAVPLALAASLWLLTHVAGASVLVSTAIYCAGLVAMVLASAAYNLSRQSQAKEILRRIDHAAIFLMIAGTYTPFAVDRLGAPTGTILLTCVWFCAMAGAALKLRFPRRFERVSVLFYLLTGWMILAVIGPLSRALAPGDFWLLFGGGFVYSAGVIFFLVERIPFHKAIWHGFVLAAVALQFSAIAGEFAT
jgi:hemolysin III